MIPVHELWEKEKRLLKVLVSKFVVEIDFRFVDKQLSLGFYIPRAKNTDEKKPNF